VKRKEVYITVEAKDVSKRKVFRCKRCGWLWVSSLEYPTVCPKCHNPYWDKEVGRSGSERAK